MLKAQEVAFSYTKNDPVLQSVSAQIVSGSFLAILGVNGCGKSTFLACLDAMLSPNGGSIMLDERPLSSYTRHERAQNIAFVTQHSHANRLTAYDTVLLGRKPFMKAGPTSEDHEVVRSIFKRLGLQDYELRYVNELSGGEYQKVILARAFAQQSNVLLLDEPTNNLDPSNQQEVMSLIRQAVDEQDLAAAVVLHDINLALRYCDRFLTLKEGKVCSCGGEETITEEIIREVYDLEVELINHNGKKVMIPR